MSPATPFSSLSPNPAFCFPPPHPYNYPLDLLPAPQQRGDERTRKTVSTATATDLTLPTLGGRHHFLLRRLHSLTGLIFGGYIVVHLLVNATLIQGTQPDIYQEQVDKIHSLPFLIGVEWVFIFLPIIYHTFYGIWITFTAQPNIGKYNYTKNWFYFWQRVSAMYIFGFMVFHVLGMKGVFGPALAFDAAHATTSTIHHLRANWFVTWVFYPLGIFASCYHLANGFWTAAITWGLTISAAAQRRWGLVCAGLFALTFISGMVAMFSVIHAKGVVR
jgi:succinate dehydrogenase / fumarate reductase cytochrome b subunit